MNLAMVGNIGSIEIDELRFLADDSRRRLGELIACDSLGLVRRNSGSYFAMIFVSGILLRCVSAGAVLLTPALIVGPLRLRLRGMVPRHCSGGTLEPFILLVGMGLQATSATLTSS